MQIYKVCIYLSGGKRKNKKTGSLPCFAVSRPKFSSQEAHLLADTITPPLSSVFSHLPGHSLPGCQITDFRKSIIVTT